MPIVIPEDPIDQPTTPIIPNMPINKEPTIQDIFGLNTVGTGTISQSDRSQLAKSGDIDITEALVRRS